MAGAALVCAGIFAAPEITSRMADFPTQMYQLSAACIALVFGSLLGHYAERRREAQRTLEEAEIGYRALLERVPAIVYTAEYGTEGRWSYVSPKIEPILGWSVAEWLARPRAWYEALHPDDCEQALAAEGRSSATGEALDSEYRMIARDGRVLWFRDQASIVRDENGAPVLLQGVMLDITSRKRAEEELELRYAVQQRLGEAASVNDGLLAALRTVAARFGWHLGAFWAVDDHADMLRLSDMWHMDGLATEPFEAASRALRLGRGEGLPGRAWAARSHVWVEELATEPNFPRAEAASVCGLHAGVAVPAWAGNEVRGVLEFFSRDSRPEDPEVVTLLAAVSAQVADYVVTHEALEEHRDRFQAVLDNAPAPVYAKDVEGRYLFVNRRFEEVVRVPRDETIGRTDREIVSPGVAEKLSEHDRSVLETGQQVEVEETVPFADGERTLLTVKFPLHDARGVRYAVCGISTDVTELKRAQQELDEREAREQSTRAKSAFLSRVSHELRTPLNAILGFGQVLEVDSITESQRNAVDQIMKGGRHLLELVNDLLEISRIDSGALKVSLAPIDVAQSVTDIVLLVQPLAGERSISLRHRADPDTPPAIADEQRVKQVLLNLLSNAIKYNREGGEVDVHVTHGSAGTVAVRIGDTGQGIAAQDLNRLFSPFERLGAEQTSVEGTGLGLALSKLMVEALNGSLEVTSAPGAGSTFTLELPAAGPVAVGADAPGDTIGKALAAFRR